MAIRQAGTDAASSGEPLVAAGRFFDTDLGLDVWSYSFTDGTTRLAPSAANVRHFSDSGCTTALGLYHGSGTAQFVVSREPTAGLLVEEFFAAGSVLTGTTYRQPSAGPCEPSGMSNGTYYEIGAAVSADTFVTLVEVELEPPQ